MSPGRAFDTDRKPRPVLVDTLAVAGFTVFAKIAGAAKTVFSARFFGPGDDLDAYLLAFLIPSFLADVLSGALSPALVPALVEAREAGGMKGVSAACADALYRSVLVLCAAALLLAICVTTVDPARVGIHLANPSLVREMVLIMAPMLPISAVTGVWRSVLNAQLRFGAAAVSPVLSPLVIIAFLFASKRYGIVVLAVGSTSGILAELAVLAFAIHRAGLPVFPKWTPGAGIARTAGKEYGAIVASNLVMRGSTLVDQTAAAMLGSGSLSIWNFGTRLVVVVIAIGPAALSTAILPRFSRMAATGAWKRLRRSFAVSVLAGMAAMAALACLLMWFSAPIVRVAFERGAFTATDAKSVARVQSCALIQAPFAVGLAIATRFVASVKVNSVLLPIAVVGLLVNAACDYALMTRYGVAGIALSATVVQAFLLAAVTFAVLRRLARIDGDA